MALFGDIPRPTTPDNKQLANYMYQLEDMLRYVLRNIDQENIAPESALAQVTDDDGAVRKKLQENAENIKQITDQAWKLNSGIASFSTNDDTLVIKLHDGRTITFTKAPVTLDGAWSGSTFTVTASDGGYKSTTIQAAQTGNVVTVWANNSPTWLIQVPIDANQLT